MNTETMNVLLQVIRSVNHCVLRFIRLVGLRYISIESGELNITSGNLADIIVNENLWSMLHIHSSEYIDDRTCHLFKWWVCTRLYVFFSYLSLHWVSIYVQRK